MPNAHLLAPEQYNMVQEIEKYAHNAEKLALIWESEAGEARQMTYQELINGANKIAKEPKKMRRAILGLKGAQTTLLLARATP